MKKIVTLLLFSSQLAIGATTATIRSATWQQALLVTKTDQAGACTVEVSTSPAYVPLVNDVNPTLFSGSNLDSRSEAVNNGMERLFVIGTRARVDQSPSDLRKYSRSLQFETKYYWRETCGLDTVTGTFTTGQVPFGKTNGDQRGDKNFPGQMQLPSVDWSKKTAQYIDPHTGAAMIVGSSPLDIDNRVYTENFGNPFRNTVGGTAWTMGSKTASYNGSSQGFLFLPTAGTTYPMTSGWSPIYIQLNANISGSASSVDVCFSLDGQNCSGKTITQGITASTVAYVVGSTVPIFESWRSGPLPPLSKDDLRLLVNSVNVAADQKNITYVSGNTVAPYFKSTWSSGTYVTVGGNVCAISSVTSGYSLTLSTPCAPTGAQTMQSQSFGFLVRSHDAGSSTVFVSSPTYTLSFGSGMSIVSAGFFPLCSPVKVNGPTGGGAICGLPVYGEYNYGFAYYWVGDDGTSNSLGIGQYRDPSSGGLRTCSGTSSGIMWSPSVAATFYCIGVDTASATRFVEVKTTGPFVNTQVTANDYLVGSTATYVSGDLEAMVKAFDPTYSSTTYPNGWIMDGTQQYGSKGVVVMHRWVGNQDTPGLTLVYDLNTNQVVGLMKDAEGLPGSVNRWGVLHSQVPSDAGKWILSTQNSDVTYYSTVTAGSFGAAPYSSCPSNSVDNSLAGQLQCTGTLTISSTTLRDSIGASFQNRQISTGDYLTVLLNGSNDHELTRILTLSGTSMVLQRCAMDVQFYYNCGAHVGTITLAGHAGVQSEMIWDWVDDPHAVGVATSAGTSVMGDPTSHDCHQNVGNTFEVVGCLSPTNYSLDGRVIRNAPIPNFNSPNIFQLSNGAFGGNKFVPNGNFNEEHPSTGLGNSYLFDARPFKGNPTNGCVSGQCAKMAGTTYMYKLLGSNLTAQFDYRVRQYIVNSGDRTLADFSGSTLTDTQADNLKFCVAIKAGDCYSGTLAGDIIMNIPYVAQVDSYVQRFDDTPPYDISVTMTDQNLNTIEQDLAGRMEQLGTYSRTLGSGLAQYRDQNIYWNVRENGAKKWIFGEANNIDFIANMAILVQEPSSYNMDSKTRNDFQQVPITVSGETGDAVRIRFGYSEYGTPSQFYCTARTSGCSTDPTRTKPYLWADETQQWQACDSGCTVNIPVLPGHYAYYVVDRKKSSGLILTTPLQVVTGE